MRDFSRSHCRPLIKGSPPVSDAEITATLAQFDGWGLENGAIVKTFSFPDYQRTLAFVNAVAWIAQREDHHPELQVHYDRCRVLLNTHSIGGISENDFICAARIEELLA